MRSRQRSKTPPKGVEDPADLADPERQRRVEDLADPAEGRAAAGGAAAGGAAAGGAAAGGAAKGGAAKGRAAEGGATEIDRAEEQGRL